MGRKKLRSESITRACAAGRQDGGVTASRRRRFPPSMSFEAWLPFSARPPEESV